MSVDVRPVLKDTRLTIGFLDVLSEVLMLQGVVLQVVCQERTEDVGSPMVSAHGKCYLVFSCKIKYLTWVPTQEVPSCSSNQSRA